METIEDIKKAYLFTEQDAENLVSIKNLMEKNSVVRCIDFLRGCQS